jgi:hypothetical protein
MFAANAEWLTRRSAAYKRDLVAIRAEVVFANIAIHDLPVADVFHSVVMIALKGAAGVVVPLDDDFVLEPSFGGPQG